MALTSSRRTSLLSSKLNAFESVDPLSRLGRRFDTNSFRFFSTEFNTNVSGGPSVADVGTSTSGVRMITSPDGRQYAAFTMTRNPKLKPYIIKRRLGRMRTYIGTEKNIRHSPWRLNLICQFVAGLPIQEALNQLEFSKKSKAPLVQKVLQRTANLADIRDGLQLSQLEIAECFATKGTPLKRIKIMGRGRAGKKERRHSHFRVVLREIDFKLRIYQATTAGQKKRWLSLQQKSQSDYDQKLIERTEIANLEKEAAVVASKKK